MWAFGIATLACILTIAATNQSVLDRLTALVFDGYQKARPRVEAGAPIAVVDIDEASIAALGQWPWPRSKIATLVDRLGEMGAAAIAFDIIFSEPDRTSLALSVEALRGAGAQVILPAGQVLDNDAILAQAIARNGVTVGIVLSNERQSEIPAAKTGFAFAGQDPQAFLLSFRGGLANLPALTDAAYGMGFFSFPPSFDGIVRTVPLVARVNGNLVPSLSVEALRTAQGAGSVIIKGTGASGEADTGRPAMTALKVGDFEVPTGREGSFWVYYSGLPSLHPISAAKVLDAASGTEFAEQVAGRIVLVGTSAIGLRDIVATPLAAGVPGVLVHAEIIDQIIGGSFLTRPDWGAGAEAATAIVLTFVLLFAALRFGPLLGAVASLFLIGAALSISWIAFAYANLLIDPVVPGVTVLAVYIVATALLFLMSDRERQFVRRAFGQYLAPALVERLAGDPSALALGGQTRELTILFCDIRGFTSLSEGLDPQSLTRLLNNFLTPMTDVLLASGATIDKYIGDSIMAFWNAPLPTEDHRRRACLAVLRMGAALDELNAREGTSIRIGVGLNTGICCVGNLGSEQRFSYSAIGDAVNVASRVEGLTKQYGLQLLVTESTVAGASDLAILEVDLVRVVGRGAPLAIFTVVGDEIFAGSEEFGRLSEAHSRMIAAYRRGEFECAGEALEAARANGLPGLAALYAVYEARLAALLAESPGPDWDGVFTAVSK